LKILEAVPLAIEARVEPGMVVALPVEGGVPAGVGTGEGVLGLLKIQLEGKKAVSVADFLRGQKGFIGDKLG